MFWDKKTGRWRSQIGHQNRKVFLGYYDTPEEAARVYDRKALELHGFAGGAGAAHALLR